MASREKVLGYFEGRGEKEVVVDPRYVRDITMVYPLPPVQPRRVTEAAPPGLAEVSIG